MTTVQKVVKMPTKETSNPSVPVDGDFISPKQLAKRLGLATQTIYTRIGRWDERHGVVRLGSKITLINWPVFCAKLMKGEVPGEKAIGRPLVSDKQDKDLPDV